MMAALSAKKSRAFSGFRATVVYSRQAPMWQRDCFQKLRLHLEDGVLPLLLLLLGRNEPLDSLLVTRVTGGHGGVGSVAG